MTRLYGSFFPLVILFQIKEAIHDAVIGFNLAVFYLTDDCFNS